jgi:hypothetical protein
MFPNKKPLFTLCREAPILLDMAYARTIATLGILSLLLSISGLPGSWKSVIIAIFGIILMYAGYQLHRFFEAKKAVGGEQTKTYAEMTPETSTVPSI